MVYLESRANVAPVSLSFDTSFTYVQHLAPEFSSIATSWNVSELLFIRSPTLLLSYFPSGLLSRFLLFSPFVISPPPFIRAPVADPFVLIGTLSVLCDGSECTGRSTSCQRNQTDSYVKSNMLLLFRRCQRSIGMDSMLLTTPGMDMCLFMHTDNFPQGWVSKYIGVVALD